MKRFGTIGKPFLLGLGAAALLLSACQKTPEKPIVVQKDQAQMVETARGDPAEIAKPPVREQVQAPERIVFATEDGKLRILADASVFVPEVSRMPVCRVSAADFTQEQAAAFWDALVGGVPMVHQRERGVYTHSELEREILRCQRAIAELPNDETRFHVESTPEEYIRSRTESLNAQIAEYTARLATAPEEIVPEAADGTLRRMDAYGVNDIGVVGYYDGIHAYADGVCSFEIENNPVYTRDYGERVGASLAFGSRDIGRPVNGRYIRRAIPVDAGTVLTAEQLAAAGHTPAEAKALVEALIRRTGAPFAVKELWLLDAAAPGSDLEEGLSRRDAHYAYHVACERIVGGAACATGFQRAYEAGQDHAAYREWVYESFDAMVDASGIACVEWRSPYALGEALVSDAALLPFSEVRAVFEQMMRVTWLPKTDEVEQMTLYVSEVRLELMRIREANSWTTGLLVPVWDFFGVRERTYGADFDNEVDRTIVTHLLTINAIDGSVIDPAKGY